MRPDDDGRPDPDELLRRLQAAEQQSARGRLRVYLGAAPGVGKTYAMLNEGRRRKERGTDVVVGFVETYYRPLTVQALEGLEVIPRRKISYQGVTLEELDTEAVIARHPQVALIDELAHTNAPGSAREKRWEDVELILDAGITVITAVNVQHLESLNDVVAGITGVRVRETVPDRVIDHADEVEIVDISPEALRSRMRHGNIYPPEQASRALESFFRPGNLAALRDLALKRVTREVEQQLNEYMRGHRLEGWETGEKTVVLLDSSHAAEVGLRRAWRLAHALGGELIAVYPKSALRQQGMTHVLTVALDLNARVEELPGEDLALELEGFVRRENATHLTLIAEPRRLLQRHTIADTILGALPHIDLHLVARSE